MGKVLWMVAALALTLVAADDPKVVAPDFKLLVDGYSLDKDPITSEEFVCRDGLVYHFSFQSKEVVVIDHARKTVEILDLDRRIQTELTFAQIEDGLSKIRVNLKRTIDDRTAKGGRANQVEAEMTGNLLEPRLKSTFDPKTRHLRLINPSVEVDVRAEAEADPLRLASIRQTLTSVVKLSAFRTPNDLPPFVELDTLASLAALEASLRPTEIVYLYRLNGPPQKFRRTYKLVPKLTDRDREALFRIDRVKEAAPIVRYERFRSK